MHKLFRGIRKLRTNENILIAVNVLFNSKTSFMSVFLMAFMISTSIKNSPIGYLGSELSTYAFCGIICILISKILRAHPVGAWRASMLFSIVRILAIILIDPNFALYPLIIGFLAGLESQLYWRPKAFLEIKEVSNSRRPRFNSLEQILIESTKIIMPVILGIVISGAGYERTAIIILIISIIQFILGIVFRPTKVIKPRHRSMKESLDYAVAHKEVRRTLWLSLIRGFVLTGCAYEIVAQLHIYALSNSNIELGSYTAATSLVAIILLFFYRRLKTKTPSKCTALVYGLMPAIILLPLAAAIMPGNFILAAALFIYSGGVVHPFYSSTIFQTYQQDVLKKEVHDDANRINIEIIGELWLCIGRVLGIIPLLFLISAGLDNLMLPLVTIEAILAPIVIIITYKYETSLTSGKRSRQRENDQALRP